MVTQTAPSTSIKIRRGLKLLDQFWQQGRNSPNCIIPIRRTIGSDSHGCCRCAKRLDSPIRCISASFFTKRFKCRQGNIVKARLAETTSIVLYMFFVESSIAFFSKILYDIMDSTIIQERFGNSHETILSATPFLYREGALGLRQNRRRNRELLFPFAPPFDSLYLHLRIPSKYRAYPHSAALRQDAWQLERTFFPNAMMNQTTHLRSSLHP